MCSTGAALPGFCVCSMKSAWLSPISQATGNTLRQAISPRTRALLSFSWTRRVKLWGTAEAIEDDPELIRTLFPAPYVAEPLQAIVFTLTAFDCNCAQHIPRLLPAEDVEAAIEALNGRIGALQAELDKLRSGPGLDP